MLVLSWLVPLVGAFGGVAYGLGDAYNLTDRFFVGLAFMSFGLVVGDAWAEVVALFRLPDRTPLRVPWLTPVLLIILHVGLGALALEFCAFDRLYAYHASDAVSGTYDLRPSSAALIVGCAAVSVVVALFQARLVRWVIVSERTASARESMSARSVPEDAVLGDEHIYEAQVLLNNLGYAVGTIDGVLSPDTTKALGRFQEAECLEQTGKVTALTMIELRNQWKETEPSPNGASMAAMAEHVGRRLARPWVRLRQAVKR